MNQLPPPPQVPAQQRLALNDSGIARLTVTITKGQKFGLTTHFFVLSRSNNKTICKEFYNLYCIFNPSYVHGYSSHGL